MQFKQEKSRVFIKVEVCLLDRTGIKVAFGVLTFLTLSLSGGKPPSFVPLTEKLARATSPSLSQGVGVQVNRMNLVACDEVEHNTKFRGKSRGAETLTDCGVGKLTPNYLTKQEY